MSDLDWRALRELAALRSRLREVLERVLMPPSAPLLGAAGSFEPAVDVWANDSAVVIEAELPGLAGDHLDVRLEDGSLLLSGDLPPRSEPGESYLRVERPRGRFARRVPLPVPVEGTPTATLQEGVLVIRLPRSARRTITIEGGGS